MPRPKGPGVIKFLDAATQDDVAMRSSLWHGKHDNPQEALTELYAREIRLVARLRYLHARKKFGISAAETELRKVRKQIKDALKQINRARKPVFQWQQKAVQLIAIHKYLQSGADCQQKSKINSELSKLIEQRKAEQAGLTKEQLMKRPDHSDHVAWQRKRKPIAFAKGAEQDRRQRALAASLQSQKTKPQIADCLTSTQGATITTDELHRQLRAEGFNVGARELRRFMRQCGVKGQQGKRSDFTSDNSSR